MEKGKRKFLVEPLQQEGVSKYGRKVSKFVFKLKNDSLLGSTNKESVQIKREESYPSPTQDPECNDIPSIELCGNSSSSGESVYEQQLQITSFSEAKKEFSPTRRKKIVKSPKKRKYKSSSSVHKADVFSSQLIYDEPVSENIHIVQTKYDERKKSKLNKKEERKTKIRKENDVESKKKKNESFRLQSVTVWPEDLNIKYAGTTNSMVQKNISKSVKKNGSNKILPNSTNSAIQSTVNKKGYPNHKESGRMSKVSDARLSHLEENVDKLIEEKIKSEEVRLRAENAKLLKKLNELKTRAIEASEIQSYQKERLTLVKLKQNQEMLYYYIGFKDLSLLETMIEKLTEYFLNLEKVCEEVLIEDQLTMTLMKLRRNYSMHDLAFRFRVSVSDSYCIVFNIILGLHQVFYENGLKDKLFPSIATIQNNLPEQFRNFPNCRVILECVRVGCEDPDNESESDIFTSTKFDPKITLKGLVGISPTKHVLFASSLYEVSTSNSDIFKDCGLVDKLEAGDLIMADKSFEICDCIPSSIELNIPASSNSTLSEKQIKNLNSKARAFIGRTTMQHIRRFCILSHIPIFLNSIAMQVFQLCSVLVNFQPTITGQTTDSMD